MTRIDPGCGVSTPVQRMARRAPLTGVLLVLPVAACIWLCGTSNANADTNRTVATLLFLAAADTPPALADIAASRRAYNYGDYSWKSGNLERAFQAFDIAIRLDPKLVLACYNRSVAHGSHA